MDSFKWKPCPTPLNGFNRLDKPITILLENGLPGICPLCSEASLRFYYHEFMANEDLKALMGKRYRSRGTIWIWCPNCGHWTHRSGVNLPKSVSYEDPLSDEDIKSIEGLLFIENLDNLWKSRRLQRNFQK